LEILGFIMPEKETITFIVPLKLKKEFEAQAKALDMTSSYALRQLMQRFIQDNSIIVHSPSDITVRLEERLNQIQESQERELAKRMTQLDLIISKARGHLSLAMDTQTKSLTEEIIELLKNNSELRGKTYQETEKVLIENQSHLRILIEEAKKQGEDPVGDAINYLRDTGLTIYSTKTKRLKWVK
jgi:hypothetical protein